MLADEFGEAGSESPGVSIPGLGESRASTDVGDKECPDLICPLAQIGAGTRFRDLDRL